MPMAAATCGGTGPGGRPLVDGCMGSAAAPSRPPGAGGGRPHMSLHLVPLMVRFAASSSAAFSAAERVV